MIDAFFNTFPANPRPEFDFNRNHMVGVLEKYFNSTTPEKASHYFILDVGIHVDSQIDEICNLRKQGKKIILMTFDPANFRRVDQFVYRNMLDKVIVFDAQFKDRFRGPKTYVTDYFANPVLFSRDSNLRGKNEVCVYGTIGHIGRPNIYNLPQLDTMVDNYLDLFKLVSSYNGVAVYDTGMNEVFSAIVHYNKAKAVEALMCGVNAYCQDGIKTRRYDRFLKRFDQIPNPVPIDFDREEIVRINDLTIKELVYECTYM